MEVDAANNILVWELLLAGIFLLFSAFFSSAETALMSADRLRLQHEAENGNKGARRLLELRSSPHRLLSTLLLGNNLVNIAAASLATAICIRLVGEGPWGIVLATGVTTTVLLIFCEIIPKSVVATSPERFSMLMINPIRWIWLTLRPLSWLLEEITRPVIALATRGKSTRKHISEDDIRTVLRLGMREGVIDRHESRFMRRVLDMGDTETRQIMTPLQEVVGLSDDATVQDALSLLAAEGYSRVPVWRGDPSVMVGMVHLKQLLRIPIDHRAGASVGSHLLDLQRVSNSEKVDDVLLLMQALHVHMVAVVDEHGTALGLATLEDLLEEIVGEIRDESDEEEFGRLRSMGPGDAIAVGSVSIHEVEDALGVELPRGDYRTLQGFISSRLGRQPTVGDLVESPEIEIRVEALAKKRVTRARLRRTTSPTGHTNPP